MSTMGIPIVLRLLRKQDRTGREAKQMARERVTVEQVAADPTNCYQVTVHGDVAIQSLTIHAATEPWVAIYYASGSSSCGTPKHWHSFVRVTD